MHTTDDNDIGYIACVNLKYSFELHDETNDFPLAVEKVKITFDQLSDYSKTLADKLHIPKANGKIAKLAPNLYDKTEYVVHYQNLKYYIRRGLILTKVHRLIRFRQVEFMANYVRESAARRHASDNEFERLYHKLCVNSLYGKLAESVSKQIDLKII